MNAPKEDPVNHRQDAAEAKAAEVKAAEPNAKVLRAPGLADTGPKKEEEKEAVKNARAGALAKATEDPAVAKANLRAEAEGGGD